MNRKNYCSADMEAQLSEFLNRHRVRKGEPHTHTTFEPQGKYYIDDDSSEKFLTLYSNAVRQGLPVTITEKPGLYGPLRVDFDLKMSLDHGLKRCYTREIIRDIVKFYQDELRECILDEECDSKMLYALVLEKKKPRVEEGVVKDGFHLHFPHFICEGWFQDEYLRNKITDKMITHKTWNGTPYSDLVSKMIDVKMARKTWLMYGATKSLKAEPYIVTIAYNADNVDIPLEDIFQDEMIGRKSSVRYYLPRFLSIKGCAECTSLKQNIEDKKHLYKPKKQKTNLYQKRTQTDVLKDIQTIKEWELMEMLSDDRADNYEQWMEIGWTLYNIGEGCEEALDLWIDFSKRSDKYLDGDCEERWANMKMGNYTLGTLKYLAKCDNPNRYKEVKTTDIRGLQERSLFEAKPNEWDISQVVFKQYQGRFLCADSKKDIWYEFKNHRWQYMDDGVTLRKLLATEIVEMYLDYKIDVVQRQKHADENERIKLESHEKKCSAIITALKECAFQDRLLRMCKIQFHDPLFFEKIDENRLLFCCENGVLDLQFGLFRDGRPDDYITLSCGIHYQTYSNDDDDVQELEDFLKKVFPNPNRRDYFNDIMSSCLEGGNVNKTFVVNTGDGDNAKTITFQLLELTFGKYCFKFPNELFIVGKGSSSSAARPELAQVRGRRLAVVDEIDKTKTIDIMYLKKLTGNDSFFVRNIYEKGGNIKPMFTLMMPCNEPPKIPGHDEATWNRVHVLDYESKFVKKKDLHKWPVPETVEEQFEQKRFKADVNFSSKLVDMAPVLLWKLFTHYGEYKKRGLKVPPEVQLATESYRAMNDIYVQFIADKIERPIVDPKTPEKDRPFLKLPILYTEFTSWYHETHQSFSKERFSRATLLHEFSKHFGASAKQGRIQGWYGYVIAQEEIDSKSNDPKQQALQKMLTKKKP